MSGAINGYVFPPPIPPSNVTARFLAGRSDQIFMPQRLPSPCQGPNPPEPSINWQNQLWPHDPNVFNPFVRLPTQFNARMQSLNNREFNWLPRGLQHHGGGSSFQTEPRMKNFHDVKQTDVNASSELVIQIFMQVTYKFQK